MIRYSEEYRMARLWCIREYRINQTTRYSDVTELRDFSLLK